MKTALKLLATAALIGSLAGCVVVPPRAEYVGPRVAVVPYYSGSVVYPAYPVYRQPYYRHGWDRRW